MSKELRLGRIVGTVLEALFLSLRIYPLVKCRLIHHLSFPRGDPINFWIPKDASQVNYASIDDANTRLQY